MRPSVHRPEPSPRFRMRALAAVGVLVSLTVLSACGGDSGSDSAAKDCTAPSGATAATKVEFDASEYKFTPSEAEVPAGVVEITLVDKGKLPHTFVIDGCTTDTRLSVSGGGSDATTLVKLDPGTYEYYCDVPTHRGLGMKGTLKVS